MERTAQSVDIAVMPTIPSMRFPAASVSRESSGWEGANNMISSSSIYNGTMSKSPELQDRRGGPSRLSSKLRRLVGLVKPEAARWWRRHLELRKRPAYLLLDIILWSSVFMVMWWLFNWSKRPHQTSEGQLVLGLGPLTTPWAVLVQHEGAVNRLDNSILEKGRLARCGVVKDASMTACSNMLILASHMLPAWTLHAVDVRCSDCTDIHSAEAALRGRDLAQRYGVFATSSAPLGRVGPMLLAMASVTDDVDVRAELRRWEWLRHVYGEGFPTVGDGAGATARRRAPYLAVLGIPSTDQPARATLREAQRKTWLGYQEVARTENHFDAALLQLYLFAAVEPPVRVDVTDDAQLTAGSTRQRSRQSSTYASLCHNTDILLPSVREYGAASSALEADRATADSFVLDIERRRVALRPAWQYTDVVSSPCDRVVRTYHAEEGAEASLLAHLSRILSLPVTPAFTSPAEYVCCASSALWHEALAHRNVVWVDMMTDRRPTTAKKIGEDGKWGLPVEVGMSQKLILWLEYAYHAFPTVPFIIKGDDDTYVKVPQFLSDVRYVVSGMQARQPPPPPRGSVSSAENNAMDLGLVEARGTGGTDVRLGEAKAAHVVDETECLYWGSLRHHLHTQFGAGMTFMMHRRVVQALLEPKSNKNRLDIVRLAAEDFTVKRTAAYRRIMFHHEDIFTGLQIYRSLARVKELCPNGRLWYVKEWYARFHDMHVGRTHNVTWSTVVAHRCRPSDAYYLHYFFREEYRIAATASRYATEEEHEAAAVKMAGQWVSERQQDPLLKELNWSGLPDVQWVRNISRRPPFKLAEGDGVAVYENRYEYWTHEATNIDDGYRSLPQW